LTINPALQKILEGNPHSEEEVHTIMKIQMRINLIR
jgi:hypothetical protein